MLPLSGSSSKAGRLFADGRPAAGETGFVEYVINRWMSYCPSDPATRAHEASALFALFRLLSSADQFADLFRVSPSLKATSLLRQ